MHNRHRRTLVAIFSVPTPTQIRWSLVEALFRHVGDVSEGSGSRVHVAINGVRASFHRPHPRPTIGAGTVEKIRIFLTEAGVIP
jgi:hypothetical protein